MTGIFEGASDQDIQFLQLALLDADREFHPLMFPTYLVELLNIYYNSMRREYSALLFNTERAVGLTRGTGFPSAWAWKDDQIRATVKAVNDLNTNIFYLERRLDFNSRFAKFIKKQVLEAEEKESPGAASRLGYTAIKDRLDNALNLLENQLHLTECMQKRSTTVLYMVSVHIYFRFNPKTFRGSHIVAPKMHSVTAQRDSSANLKIAIAAKEDSEVMKVIAFFTMTFLPATLITVSALTSDGHCFKQLTIR